MEETKVHLLPSDIQELCLESLRARQAAYVPYSNFKVGAALRTACGEVVSGCNVENASYGLAICAERTACVKAVSRGIRSFTAIAIAADMKGIFVGPCGACRQFLCEFNPDLPIYLVRLDQSVQVTNLERLLPDCFSPKRMKFAFHNGNSV